MLTLSLFIDFFLPLDGSGPLVLKMRPGFFRVSFPLLGTLTSFLEWDEVALSFRIVTIGERSLEGM